MILCIDMGNTSTLLGVFSGEKLLFSERFETRAEKTDLEYMLDLQQIFKKHRLLPSELEGGILSSVVPNARDILRRAVKRFCNFSPLLVSYKMNKSFCITLEHPEELGANLIALSEGAVKEIGVPAIVIRTGTATTVSVLNEKREYLGGLILPGMQASMKALTDKTGLPALEIHPSDIRFPKETLSCLNTGALFGNAGMIEGVVSRLLALFPGARIIATGRQAGILRDYMDLPVQFDDTLVLKGLFLLYGENQ